MRDMPKILIGLAIFVVLVAFPIWYNLASGTRTEAPDPIVETQDDPARDQCVLPEGQMRTQHMDLLMDWRDEVVRQHDRYFQYENDGQMRTLEKSLTKTCLDCHPNKDTFCDRCHTYMDVDPYCWDCHVIPQDLEGGR